MKIRSDQPGDRDRDGSCFAAPQAEAIEVYGTGAGASQMDDGLLVQVRGGARRGGGGMHRGSGGCTVAEAE